MSVLQWLRRGMHLKQRSAKHRGILCWCGASEESSAIACGVGGDLRPPHLYSYVCPTSVRNANKQEQEDSLVGGGDVSAGVTVKVKGLDVDKIRKLAVGVYVAVAEYAPVASGWSGVNWYVTTPGPVLLTCCVKTALGGRICM